jgi:glycosyltransferase involved in cell wall biosynthesis
VQSITRLCEGLAALGHIVEVFTTDAGIGPEESISPGRPLERNGVRVTYFSRTPGYGIRCQDMERAVTDWVREFDLVHITGVWQRTSFSACRAATRAGIPYVVSPRGALGPYSWRHKTIKKTVYWFLRERSNVRGAAAVHYTTAQEQRECDWLCLPGRSFIAPNPVDITSLKFDPEGARCWREKFGIRNGEFLILSVGRLHHKKGLDLLPSTLAPIRALPWCFAIVGDDEDGTRIRLMNAFRAAGLSERIRFVDAVVPSVLSSIYSAANLFVLPSRHENFGNVVVEAMACRCPVMVTPEVGLSEDVLRAGAGFVVKRNARNWSEALMHAIGQPAELAAARNQALVFSRIFSRERVAAQMAWEYGRTLAEHRRPHKT